MFLTRRRRSHFTAGRISAAALQHRFQQTSRRSGSFDMSLDVRQFRLRHGPEAFLGGLTEQLPDLGHREPGLLEERNDIETPENVRVVVTTASHSSFGPDQASLLVVAER